MWITTLMRILSDLRNEGRLNKVKLRAYLTDETIFQLIRKYCYHLALEEKKLLKYSPYSINLWVLRFDEQDLCCSFEEWPFSPDQDDGHHI
jgi:hypothetical protein